MAMFKVIRVQRDKNKRGEVFYWVFFKSLEDGSSARSYVCPGYGNWKRWKDVVSRVLAGEEVVLEGLRFRGRRLIDADSAFRVVRMCPSP